MTGASNAELREMSVEATPSAATNCNAIFNNGTSPRITRVTATATGGSWQVGVYNINGAAPALTSVTASATNNGLATANGVRNESGAAPTLVDSVVTGTSAGGEGMVNVGASATLDRVTVTGAGGPAQGAVGIYNDSSSLTIRNSTITANSLASNNKAIRNLASTGAYTVTITGSRIVGATNTISNDSHFTTRIAATQLDGGPAAWNSGTLVCAGVWDGVRVLGLDLPVICA